jgi:hypothetical protein
VIDLEAIAAQRAEAQLESGGWRHKDRDESMRPFRRCPACRRRKVVDSRSTVCGHCNPRGGGLKQRLKLANIGR